MRGGITYIAQRYIKANSKYIKFCDDTKPSKYIMYMDPNNLYSWPMNQYLPYSKFRWLNQKGIDTFDVNAINENGLNGYILEVDH